MKLYSLSILYRVGDGKANRLVSAYELSSFGFFQRSSVKEFMNFSTKILVERTSPSCRSSVKEQEYVCHVYVKSNNVGAVVIADHEYPQRVAHTLLNKAIEDFEAKVDKKLWSIAKEDEIKYPELEQFLQKYQNPREADAMSKINADLDETKIILHNTIEAVLERGEKIDDLVEKSEGLSLQSKTFYKTARKTNSCCVIL
ncbi:synaptobrevin homolog YKT6-like [Ruditapes philippinarum]|uniref:synaptobrevin homolog YKT6-like n=1 Tax=Ruditapes philippinarum TaxID=129788 RepID=UPI00295B661D|nr:synaptobrevin homolog YKT6-like [Ruditapes philippinarum]